MKPNNRPQYPVNLVETVVIRSSPRALYRFLTADLSARYRELARGHERFEVIGGGPLVVGALVDCRERAGNQEVHHRYVVERLVPDELVRYASTPSTTYVHLPHRTLTGTSDTIVEYRVAPGSRGVTTLEMTISIVFASRLQRAIARGLGRVYRVWKHHQREELAALTRLLEDAEARAPAT